MGRKKARFYKDLPKTEHVDTNTAIIEAHAREPKEARQVPDETSKPIERPVIASRRERQMERYIAKKLKKDARPDLLARLVSAQQQQPASQGLTLLSTKNLLVPSKRRTNTANHNSQPTSVEAFTMERNDGFDSGDEDNDNNVMDDKNGIEAGGRIKSPLLTSKVIARIPESVSMDMLTAIASLKRSSLNPLPSSEEEGLEQSESDKETDAPEAIKLDNTTIVGSPAPTTLTAALPISEKAYYVLVQRDPIIEEQRSRLPIYAEEQIIMETILKNPVTIICGETGSGKTTQVPQFLYEAGFGDPACPLHGGLIGVTQPRRVAALAVAQRIAQELGRPEHVAHQIRLESSVRPETRIKLMTDGVLLRELQGDFLLRRYSVILLDEAHERNLNTDILIGMLSRAVRLRNQLVSEKAANTAGGTTTGPSSPLSLKPLRLVIMSATLKIDEFMAPQLFNPAPPLIKIDARQHPVTNHFARHTDPDYVSAAFRTIKKIHTRLPPGGILVFLTGKREIHKLATMLNRNEGKGGRQWLETEEADEYTINDPDGIDAHDDYEDGSDDEKAGSDNDNTSGDDDGEFNIQPAQDDQTPSRFKGPLHVLPLYSLLAPEEQMRVFAPPPEGSRLCVLATNVAETSLTIPGIRYVVDSGKVKVRSYDASLGASHYGVQWCSQASATQRAGRAGRLGPGHCYRLYSAAVYEQQFPAWSPPEIERGPVDGLVLQLAAMGIDHPSKFPLPTPPPPEAISGAQRLLVDLRALAPHPQDSTLVRITGLGRRMSSLPLAPVWSRLLVMALEGGTVSAPLAVALVSVMSIGDPMVQEGGETSSTTGISPVTSVDGDLIYWTRLFAEYMTQPSSGGARKAFCVARKLMSKRMEEMHQQFFAIRRSVSRMYPEANFGEDENRSLLNAFDRDTTPLRRLIGQSLPGQAAARINRLATYQGRRIKLPAYRRITKDSDQLNDNDSNIAFLHPSSVLARSPPPALAYGELSMVNGIPYMKYVTPINLAWIGR